MKCRAISHDISKNRWRGSNKDILIKLSQAFNLLYAWLERSQGVSSVTLKMYGF